MRRERFRISWARFLDRFPGGFLVWLCALRRRPYASTSKDPPRKILFIKLWGMGSVILTQPALAELRRLHPRGTLHYLTFEQNRQLFDFMPAVDKVYTVSFANLRGFLRDSLRLIGQLRREQYDLILDAEFLANYSTLLARLSSPACRIVGFGRPGEARARLLDSCIPVEGQGHVRDHFVDLVSQGKQRPRLWTAPQIQIPARRDRSGPDLPDVAKGSDPLVVVNVNAGPLAPERRWPRLRFVGLCRCLLDRYQARIVLIGSASECGYVAPVAQALGGKPVCNLCGRLTLRRLASLLERSSLMISNDSGPLHMAAALGVPVVGFFGPESPERYGPLGRRRLVFYRGLWCSPCMSVTNAKAVHCQNHLRCLKDLDATAVARRVGEFIDRYRLLARRQPSFAYPRDTGNLAVPSLDEPRIPAEASSRTIHRASS